MRIGHLFFGTDAHTPEREPEPITESERWLAYAGAVFLVAVTVYLVTAIWRDADYQRVLERKMIEKCVLRTADARWCRSVLID